MGVPFHCEARTRGAGAVAYEIDAKSGRAELALLGVARRGSNAPARPGGARLVERAHEDAARAVAFGEQEQTPRCFEFERLGARGERADDDSAGGGKPLLGGPQRFVALAGADDDQPVGVEAEVSEADGVRGALLSEDALLAGPDHPRLTGPAGGEAQGKAEGGRLRARSCRTQLMQGRGRHLSEEGIESSSVYGGACGGWTGSHVLYMF